MTTESPRKQSATAAPIPPASRALTVLYVIVCAFPAVFGAYFGLPALLERGTVLQAVERYHAQCPALTILLDSTTSPARCLASTAQVVDRYARGSGQTTSHGITIQLPAGQRYPLHISDDDVWNGIAVGQQAEVQLWEGHVTGLVVNDQTIKTNDNPDSINTDNTGRLLFMGMCIGGSAILLGLPLVLKSARGAPYQRSIVTTSFVLYIGAALRLLL